MYSNRYLQFFLFMSFLKQQQIYSLKMLSYLNSFSSSALPNTFLIFLLITIEWSSVFASAQENKYIYSICDTVIGNYTQMSTYKTNLDQVLSDLVTTSSASHHAAFYNTSHGTGADQAYGIFYCRFDIKSSLCHDCIKAAAKKILQDCTVEKTAVIWYDTCTLRFANYSLYSNYEKVSTYSVQKANVSTPNEFFHAMSIGITQLINQAAYNTSYQGHAYGVIVVSDHQKVHCFVQCRPDTTGNDCEQCLVLSIGPLEVFRQGGSVWATVMAVNCQLRYNISPFLDVSTELLVSTDNDSPSSVPSGEIQSSGKHTANYITRGVIPAVAAIIVLLILCGVCFCYIKIRKDKSTTNDGPTEPWLRNLKDLEPTSNQVPTQNWQSFNFKAIEIATSKFSNSNILGEGGFGVVYWGQLENGKQVAIKRLSKDAGQGVKEFKTEVEVLARLQHRNLVRILGCCIEGEEKLLVYDFLLNLSLDRLLFDQRKSHILTWPIRYTIISGIVRGLHYLHEDSRLTIIHRDLKTSNILLDEQFNPKIGDFGIARLVKLDQTTGFSTKIIGTIGYMAPEYTNIGRFSTKSDVYSLGVVILEVLSGVRVTKYFHPIHGGLLRSAWRFWYEKSIKELVDPTLGNDYTSVEVEKCIHICLLCVQDDVARRPTIHTVLQMLNNNLENVTLPLISSSYANEVTIDDKYHGISQCTYDEIRSQDTSCLYGR